MGPFARFVTRPIGDGASDLILGAFLRNGQKALKPNTIYQMGEFLGEITVTEVGPSLVSEGAVADSPIRVTWCQSYEYVAVQAGQYLLISQKEYEMILQRRKEENECDF